MKDTGPSPEVRRLVHARSGGICERCRAARAVDVHHRRARGMGGSTVGWINSPSNLVDLCRKCHEWVEANFTAALATGWKIGLADSPLDVRIQPLVGGEWIPAATGGRWVYVPPDGDSPSWF